MFSLQSISWEKFGRAKIFEQDDKIYIDAKQELDGDYVKLTGEVIIVNKDFFYIEGNLTTRVSHINNGKECLRNEKFSFKNYKGYFRLQEMGNPCDRVTDYVDIFIR